MKLQWQQLASKFNGLSQRERVLVACASLVLVIFSCFMLLEPMLLDYQQRAQHLRDVQHSNQMASQSIAVYQEGLALDPDADYKQRLASVEKQLMFVDAELSQQMVDMIPADYMPTVLAQLLSKVKGLKLLGFNSLAPQALLGEDDNTKLNLYSHGIKLTLEGDYFSFLNFVQAVEAMPDKLYWKRLDYQVDKHPQASIELELYTLSINKDFISVAKHN
ncbi:MSHA biogenesis protein MshJ [Shewanella sp. SR44-3]|uniref:MSHA biogenesis protein MshJ n=1 Tax=unclassified Shewanella TaxID=196818 RepID=UPI0015F86238|nr:MSHA biogenesis protein MshJ [Shewanella sp. SR44-3]MBB1269638.1 MSHA biogenesis protein MshJ [Shewanella sp. SR44-3]